MRFASVESDMHLLCRGFRVPCAVLLALVLSPTVALAQTRSSGRINHRRPGATANTADTISLLHAAPVASHPLRTGRRVSP
jgi:hypothetical protein